MRRTGRVGTAATPGRRARVALLALPALLALGACTDDPATPSPSPTAAGTSPPSSSSAPPNAATVTPSLPAGCTAPSPAPAGAVVVTAAVGGTSVMTERQRYDVPLGSAVRIEVTTDVADEVHVHGYDLRAVTKPGCPTALDLTANIPGSVEVELERGHLRLFELRSR
ncbi:MAG TPA: hypothetical protein VNA20_02470 [Frankiaceae bacterium]|nr:hypothetical protein [Frankiaceae bacterium]